MSKPLVVSVPHQLGRVEARKRLDEGVGKITQQFAQMGEVMHKWDGDNLRFRLVTMGQEVTGHIEVGDETVRIEVLLPAFLAMIAGSLKGRLQKQGQILLEDKGKR
jgi:putative polyhydroxyalkanoate system protein